MASPLSIYLTDIASALTGAGVAETSGYPALVNLLNSVGKTIKPPVIAVANPASIGAGIPDIGLYTPDQLPKSGDPDPTKHVPARGVVEAKGLAARVDDIAKTPQVTKYLDRYGLVLVTNFREFVLLGRDTSGAPFVLDRYVLADSPTALWQVKAADHDARFVDFLRRVMLTNAPLSSPQDVAAFLASYAREAKARVEGVEGRYGKKGVWGAFDARQEVKPLYVHEGMNRLNAEGGSDHDPSYQFALARRCGLRYRRHV